MLEFRADVRPPIETVIDLYCAAPVYRPIDDVDRMRRMFDGANVVLTAWDGGLVVRQVLRALGRAGTDIKRGQCAAQCTGLPSRR